MEEMERGGSCSGRCFLKSRRLRIYFCYNVKELRRHRVGIQEHHVGILSFTHRGDVTEAEENQDKLTMFAG